eukprot:comp21912_c0_seq1/m.31466 comp21912_c0_seq1/g.31466  ORF comp21912_c0_seq1/g.31466 comp21912_c0_seq1/m.31466 type:complete len:616 (-) comp21912_c0_seq1:301-2148(-)
MADTDSVIPAPGATEVDGKVASPASDPPAEHPSTPPPALPLPEEKTPPSRPPPPPGGTGEGDLSLSAKRRRSSQLLPLKDSPVEDDEEEDTDELPNKLRLLEENIDQYHVDPSKLPEVRERGRETRGCFYGVYTDQCYWRPDALCSEDDLQLTDLLAVATHDPPRGYGLTKDGALHLLADAKFDVSQARWRLYRNKIDKAYLRSEWSAEDTRLFEQHFWSVGKNFHKIAKLMSLEDSTPRTCKSVIEFYYRWKNQPRQRMQVQHWYTKEKEVQESNSPRAESVLSADSYEVERILGERTAGGHREYRVKWKGYDEETWEKYSTVKDLAALDVYLREKRQAQSTGRSRGRSRKPKVQPAPSTEPSPDRHPTDDESVTSNQSKGRADGGEGEAGRNQGTRKRTRTDTEQGEGRERGTGGRRGRPRVEEEKRKRGGEEAGDESGESSPPAPRHKRAKPTEQTGRVTPQDSKPAVTVEFPNRFRLPGSASKPPLRGGGTPSVAKGGEGEATQKTSTSRGRGRVKEVANGPPSRQKQTPTRKKAGRKEGRTPSKSNEEVYEVEPVFEVERIYDMTYSPKGTALYRVRWAGYGSEEDSWEPEEMFTNPMVLAEFKRSKGLI